MTSPILDCVSPISPHCYFQHISADQVLISRCNQTTRRTLSLYDGTRVTRRKVSRSAHRFCNSVSVGDVLLPRLVFFFSFSPHLCPMLLYSLQSAGTENSIEIGLAEPRWDEKMAMDKLSRFSALLGVIAGLRPPSINRSPD